MDVSSTGKDTSVVISKTWWGIEGFDLWSNMVSGLPLRLNHPLLDKCMMIGMASGYYSIASLRSRKGQEVV